MKRNAERYIAYKITNTVNGVAYIGITSQTICMRWSRHKRSAFKENVQTKLYRAMRKYGAEVFVIAPLAEAYSLREILVLEQALISAHATWHGAGGYNMTFGGDSFGKKLSTERRAMIGEHTRRRWESGELRIPREERSALMKAVYAKDPTYGARISASKTGKKLTPEQREALRPSRRAPWESATYRERMLPILAKNTTNKFKKGQHRSREFIDKNRAARVMALREKIEAKTGVKIDGDPYTHCARGHERTDESTRRQKDGIVKCRICRRLSAKAKRETVIFAPTNEVYGNGQRQQSFPEN